MLEPLTDLPVEEPLEAGVPVRPARDSSVQVDAQPAPSARPAGEAREDELIDPEVLLGAIPATIVAGNAAATPSEVARPQGRIDPDELLSAELLTGDVLATPSNGGGSSGPKPLTPPELSLTDEPPDSSSGATARPDTSMQAGPAAGAAQPSSARLSQQRAPASKSPSKFASP